MSRTTESYAAAGKLGFLAVAEKQQQSLRKRICDYDILPTKCHHCNKDLPYEKRHLKFCGASCSATFNNRQRIKKVLKRREDVKVVTDDKNIPTLFGNCKFCNSDFSLKNKKTQLYCSASCKSKEVRVNIQKKILGGDVNGHSSNTLRQCLIDTRGCKCELCGISEWRGKPLVVIMDHIDGNSSNNSLLNLQLVCSNCDANLPTYKSKNKGNGRFSRKQRYKDGFSS